MGKNSLRSQNGQKVTLGFNEKQMAFELSIMINLLRNS